MYRSKSIQAFHFFHIVDREISPLMDHKCQGHIHHHIVESAQFLNEDTFDDEVDSDDDCDNDCDIEDLHTAKPLRKGLKYFTSGHVQKCKTVLRVDIIF